MSVYTNIFFARYQTPSLLKQTEVAMVKVAADILLEDVMTTDHPNRVKWAKAVQTNSSAMFSVFAWPIAFDPAIQTSVSGDASGAGVLDDDVLRVVTANAQFAVQLFNNE
jgi:hypothetical protein